MAMTPKTKPKGKGNSNGKVPKPRLAGRTPKSGGTKVGGKGTKLTGKVGIWS